MVVVFGGADPYETYTVLKPWRSAAELTATEANTLISQSLPPGSTITGRLSATAENTKAIAGNYQAPYISGTQVLEITTTQPTQYVRVFVEGGESRQIGSWVMRAEDIKGLTPEQIASKYGLPQVPTMVGDVSIPAGTKLNVSAANGISPNASKGIFTGDNVGGGGVQFQIQTRPANPSNFARWFSNPRPLK